VESVRASTANCPPSSLPSQPAVNLTLTELRVCSEEDVRRATKSCSLDPIPTFILKDSLDVLLTFVTAMMNASLRDGRLPASQKTSIQYTAAQEAVTGCWRPEELSTSIQLDVHVEGCREDRRWATCRILAVKRSDAAVAVRHRRQHSTETALLRVLSDIFCAADRQHVTLLGLLDLSAALDCVDHDILIHRLQRAFGFGGTVIAWIQSFLCDSTQQVSYADAFGVPQGSVLGSLLFYCTLLSFSTSSRRPD